MAARNSRAFFFQAIGNEETRVHIPEVSRSTRSAYSAKHASHPGIQGLRGDCYKEICSGQRPHISALPLQIQMVCT